MIWFTTLALLGIIVLARVGSWYSGTIAARTKQAVSKLDEYSVPLPRGRVVAAVAILLALIFSKYFYLAGMNSYFTFFLIDRFGLSVQAAQLHLFLFQASVAVGTLIGGPVGDRIGRKYVIWGSILGAAPFTLLWLRVRNGRFGIGCAWRHRRSRWHPA